MASPLSQSTTVSFSTEASDYTDISIINLLGVEVAKIFSGKLEPGEHNFTWAPSPRTNIPNGLYECLIRMNGHVEKLPMLLMR